MSTGPKFPVFIIGSPRSGTSAIIDALLGVGYHGFREGNFLPLISSIGRIVDRHFATFGRDGPQVLVSHVDPQALKSSINAVLAGFANNLHPVAPWVDKSGNPEMIEAIPGLLQLWPEAHFIFAKRRAVENVASRVKKFPRLSFEFHCRDWARNMQAWRQVRDRIPEGRAIEVDQQDLIRDPEAAAERIAKLIDLAPARTVGLLETFRRGRPQQTEDGSAQRILVLSDLWTKAQRETFEEICGDEMKAYGYTIDETYWQEQ